MHLDDPVQLIRDEEGRIIDESLPQLAALASMASQNNLDYPGREKTVKIARRLAPHVFGEDPVEIISKQRPNEPDDVKKYRVDVWEPETTAFFGRFFNVVSRIGAPSAFAITYPPSPSIIGDDSFEQYAENEYGDFKSIHNFTFEVLHQWIYGDPNAVLAIFDPHIEFDEVGNISDEYTPNPQPFIYPSEYVVWKRERKEYLIKTDYKSPVLINQETVMKGKVYLYADQASIYFMRQFGQQSEHKFEVIKWQDHYVPNTTPCITLGGDLKTKGSKKWYESFIQPAVADWNKYIGSRSDLDAWKTRTMYPVPVIAAADCPTCKTSKRKGYLPDQASDWIKCDSCGGSGKTMMTFGPMAALHIDKDRHPDMKPQDAIFYPTIDTSLFEPAFKDLENFERKGFAALNMEMLASTPANESGRAKAIDRKPLEDFLLRIAARVYFLIDWQYKVSAYERYGGLEAAQPGSFVEDLLPEITRPYKLSYETLEMLFDELQKSTSGGAHSSIIRAENKEIASRKYGPESLMTKRIQAEIDLDPHVGAGADDLLSANAIGATDKLSLFIHWNIKQLVDTAINQNEGFLMLPKQEQQEIILQLATEQLPTTVTGPTLPVPPVE